MTESVCGWFEQLLVAKPLPEPSHGRTVGEKEQLQVDVSTAISRSSQKPTFQVWPWQAAARVSQRESPSQQRIVRNHVGGARTTWCPAAC
jgi:hypothetical protein